MNSRKSNDIQRIIGLNTLRFSVFLAILIGHTFEFATYGIFTRFFFVLTGFLLTYLTYNEWNTKKSFNKKNFLIRRALRIFPLYYFVLILAFYFLPVVAPTEVTLPESKLLYWLFLSNYETSNHIFALKFLWAVSVQVQFYFFFIIIGSRIKKFFWQLQFIIFLIHIIFITTALYYHFPLSANFFYHLPSFMAGMIAANLYLERNPSPRTILVVFVAIIAVIPFFHENIILSNFIFAIGYGAILLMFIALANKIQFNPIFKTSERLGAYTYGLYVYSGFVITFITAIFHPGNGYTFILSLLILIPVAATSYYLFERPVLKLKTRFR